MNENERAAPTAAAAKGGGGWAKRNHAFADFHSITPTPQDQADAVAFLNDHGFTESDLVIILQRGLTTFQVFLIVLDDLTFGRYPEDSCRAGFRREHPELFKGVTAYEFHS